MILSRSKFLSSYVIDFMAFNSNLQVVGAISCDSFKRRLATLGAAMCISQYNIQAILMDQRFSVPYTFLYLSLTLQKAA